MAGIGYCVYGYALALHRRKSSSGKLHTYVRCGKSADGCRGAKTLADVELLLEDEFLAAYGDEEMTRQVFVPGEDHSRELEQTEQSLERLRWESDNGLVNDENLYRSRPSALVARSRTIRRYRCPCPMGLGWHRHEYREAWDDPTTDRRQVLGDSRIRLVLHLPPYGTKTQTKVIQHEYRVPEDWPEPVLTDEQRAIRESSAESRLSRSRTSRLDGDASQRCGR
jgi:site-specific DNA recombinase